MTDTPQTLARPLAERVGRIVEVYQPPTEQIPLSESIIDAAFDALDAGHTHYTDRPGILPLREKIAAQLNAQYSTEISADTITITCGAKEARFVAIKQLVKPNHWILCLTSWRVMARPGLLLGVETTGNPKHAAIDMIYANSDDDPERLRAAVDSLPDAWLVFEVLPQSLSQSKAAFSLPPEWADRTLIIGEIAGMYSWRVGWMAGSKAANKLRAYKQSMTICTTSISQWAALGAFE